MAVSCALELRDTDGLLMAEALNKSLLRAFANEFVSHSESLSFHSFAEANIAAKAFPNSSRANAKSRLSAALSPAGRPLTRGLARSVLEGCRKALQAQYAALGKFETAADQFESAICRKMNFSANRATPHDFRADRLLESVRRPEDLGFPDLMEWLDGSYQAAARLNDLQRHSIEMLREIIPLISRAESDERRLDLLQIAISIAAVHHPGTRWHELAYNMTNSAADNARLFSLANSYGVAESLKQRAHRLMLYLHFIRLSPTLDSPTNYARSILNGRRLDMSTWHDIRFYLEQAILSAERQLVIDPNNVQAVRERSSVISMKARLLAATGDPAALREADHLHELSLDGIEKVPFPYGLAYPIVKDIVQGRIRCAIQKCEAAIAANEMAGKSMSTNAFAALYFHLTAIHWTDPTADRRIRKLAREAIGSPSTAYQCSHVFDASAVRQLLPKGRPPKA
jgi:hypothetical protein